MRSSSSATRVYYLHARRLGAYRAIDALALARQAAALDEAAAMQARAPFVDVSVVDGCRLSNSIRVY